MDHELYLNLGELMLHQLQGALHFSITDEERWSLAEKALSEIAGTTVDDQFVQIYKNHQLRQGFLRQFLSYDEVDELIHNPEVEDIDINSTGPVYAHMTNKGFVKTNKSFKTHRYLDFFKKKLIIFSGRVYLRKIHDYGLPNIHGRVNIVHSPFGPQITITKAKELPLSIIQLIEKGALDYKIAGFLWIVMEGMGFRPANLLIVGGPGAGKTTLLNALLSFVPSNDRVVVIEDTLELNTKFMDNFSRLESGEDLSLEYLVKNTLRMRPERVIVGEVRGREAQDMMTAMNIGKYCMGTIHASNTKEAFARLENTPMNVPPALINLIDIFIVLRRFRHGKTIHRVIEEISETSFMHQQRPLVSVIWRYDINQGKMVELTPLTTFRDKLSETGGLTPVEILDEWDLRAKILYLLSEKGVSAFQEVNRFCSMYHEDREQAFDSFGFTMEELNSLPSQIG